MYKKPSPLRLLLSFLLLAILFYVNVFVYLHKQQGYVYKYSNHFTVHYPQELPVIQSFKFIGDDSVSFKISNRQDWESRWQVLMNDSISYECYGGSPKLYLPQKNRSYTSTFAVSNSGSQKSVFLKIQWQKGGSLHIIESSLPITTVGRYPLSAFCDVSWIDPEELARTRDIVFNRFKLDTSLTIIEQVELLSRKIRASTYRGMGNTYTVGWPDRTAFQLYDLAVNGKTRIACNEYSEIYYLFANVAGIPTRRVALVGRANANGVVKLTGHHFNESFIREQNSWARVDLLYDIAYVTNNSGDVMSTYDLLVANESNTYDELTVASVSDDTVTYVPYVKILKSEKYWFNRNAIMLYYFGKDRLPMLSQIARYLFAPELSLSYSGSNCRLTMKYVCMVALLLTAVYTLVLGMAYLRHIRRK